MTFRSFLPIDRWIYNKTHLWREDCRLCNHGAMKPIYNYKGRRWEWKRLMAWHCIEKRLRAKK